MRHFVNISDIYKKTGDFEIGPIDFTIEPGTITALVGDNGSGKSTLMKMMMELVNFDTGTIEMFGNQVGGENESWKKLIGYQPQTWIGIDNYTGNELVELISHFYPNWDQVFFETIVKKLGIPLAKRFGKLSLGVQQKLNFALTIARNPKLLILDEPTAAIDIPAKHAIMNIITEWMEDENRAILLSSHVSEDIQKLADYITVLRGGKMIGHFEKEALTSSYRSYWLMEPIPNIEIPGEVSRNDQELISNNPAETESFLKATNLTFTNSTAVDLDEIITLLLTN